jgi:hypothetical protein
MKTTMMCLVAFLLASVSWAESPSFSKASIYYIPFQIETYVPVTQENIREKANYQIEVIDAKSVAALLTIISGGDKTTEFDEMRVRLLLVWDDGKQKTVVDTKGNVLEGKMRRSLGKAEFGELQNLLSGLVATKSAPEK